LGGLVMLGWGAVSALLIRASDERPQPARSGLGIQYHHDEVAEMPWSIHVLKIDRTRADLEFHTTLARGGSLGLTTLSEQLKALPPALGQPLGAINGDFWREGHQPAGDPTGLQIRQGELVSAPCERPCFWIDTQGQPQATNVLAQFAVTWPDGQSTLFGLNEERTNHGAVLFTAAVGASTKTRGGRELVLERAGDNPWLPLRVGESYTARVRDVREAGDAPLTADTVVLSLSPELAARLPRPALGSTLKFATETTPSLRGVKVAIGGGPMLVRDGKSVTFSGSQSQHPRTAIGWNDKYFFFIVVDGRQSKLSVGMSFPELAAYFVKLGCQRAMNLDGGGSATFWVRGQVMNSPCYGHERPMANALVLVQKPKAPGSTRQDGAGP
jgi:hypothetical protein